MSWSGRRAAYSRSKDLGRLGQRPLGILCAPGLVPVGQVAGVPESTVSLSNFSASGIQSLSRAAAGGRSPSWARADAPCSADAPARAGSRTWGTSLPHLGWG